MAEFAQLAESKATPARAVGADELVQAEIRLGRARDGAAVSSFAVQPVLLVSDAPTEITNGSRDGRKSPSFG